MLPLLALHLILLSCSRVLISNALAASISTKAGLAWPNENSDDIEQYTSTGKVTWYYTWSPSSVSTGLEFVPMLWGDRQVSEWESSINQTIQDLGVTRILGFNEPDYCTQSNMTPSHGASVWKAQIEPLRSHNIQLGSPAPTSAPEGKQWLLDWLNACDGGCTVDFIALHWYDINSTAFIEYLEDFHDTFQKPLWITEWACQNFNVADEQCSLQNIVDFMNVTQSFMDATDWVGRYAWFGAMENLQGVNQDDAIMDSSGRINALGEQYIGVLVPQISSNYTPGVVNGGSGSSTSPSLKSVALSCGYLPRTSTLFILSAVVMLLLAW